MLSLGNLKTSFHCTHLLADLWKEFMRISFSRASRFVKAAEPSGAYLFLKIPY